MNALLDSTWIEAADTNLLILMEKLAEDSSSPISQVRATPGRPPQSLPFVHLSTAPPLSPLQTQLAASVASKCYFHLEDYSQVRAIPSLRSIPSLFNSLNSDPAPYRHPPTGAETGPLRWRAF
jgi:hypothetical protein